MTSFENASAVATKDAAQDRLDVLLSRIHELTATGDESTAPMPVPPATASDTQRAESAPRAPKTLVSGEPMSDQRDSHGDWFPNEPEDLRAAGLTESEVEDLLLKNLNARSEASGRDLAEQVKVPFRIVDPLLQQMKQDQMVGHRGASVMNDYIYQLTNKGRERRQET